MTMSQWKAKRLLQPVLLAITLGALTSPAAGAGSPCTESSDPPPECQNQTMAPVYYGLWESKTWAYYCTGDHPYYWGPAYSDDTGNWEVLNSGFTHIENLYAEFGNPSKLDSEFTNWYGGQSLIVVMACSRQKPPLYALCRPTGPSIADPGCPKSNIREFCRIGVIPFCVTDYDETCNNRAKYDCTNVEAGLYVWCQACTN